MDELFIAHKEYLPQFTEAIANLESAGLIIKDEMVRGLMEG